MRRLDFEERMGLRRLIQAHAHIRFQRVEEVERGLERSIRARVVSVTKQTGLCGGCGHPVSGYSVGCRACQLRHNLHWRRFMREDLLPGQTRRDVLESHGRARLVAS